MKNMKQLFMFGFMVLAVMPLFAKKSLPNKDQVFFTNAYGGDVAVSLVWEGGIFPSEQEFILKSHHVGKMFKAPYSRYHLTEISVTPSVNLEGRDLAKMATVGAGIASAYLSDGSEQQLKQSAKFSDATYDAVNLGYAITKALNSDILHVRGDKYFVIENKKEKSRIPGQKKIVIKEYADKESYEKTLEKVAEKTPELIETNSEIEKESIEKFLRAVEDTLSENKITAQQKLELEKKRLALRLEQLTLEEKEMALAKNK